MALSQLARELEALVDTHGLANVLYELRELCDGKAEHIRTNWQDGATAHAWDRAAIQIGNTANRVVKYDRVQFTRSR